MLLMFIPIGDDNSRRRTFPFVMLVLIGLNAVVWYLQLRYGQRFMAAYAAVPLELSTGRDLIHPVTTVLKSGEHLVIPQAPGPSPIWLTGLISMFMHGSWLHIIGNMVYLFIFGDQIEDEFGHFKFLFFYLAAGLGAAAAQVMADPTSVIPCVGASGAIAGTLGAYLVLHPSNRVQVLVFRSIVYMPASIVLGMWIIMQIFGHIGSVAGQASGVAYMAHIGGFAVGFLVGFLVRFRSRSRHSYHY